LSVYNYNTRLKVGSNLFVPRMLSKLGQKALLLKGVKGVLLLNPNFRPFSFELDKKMLI